MKDHQAKIEIVWNHQNSFKNRKKNYMTKLKIIWNQSSFSIDIPDYIESRLELSLLTVHSSYDIKKYISKIKHFSSNIKKRHKKRFMKNIESLFNRLLHPFDSANTSLESIEAAC